MTMLEKMAPRGPEDHLQTWPDQTPFFIIALLLLRRVITLSSSRKIFYQETLFSQEYRLFILLKGKLQ